MTHGQASTPRTEHGAGDIQGREDPRKRDTPERGLASFTNRRPLFIFAEASFKYSEKK